MIAGLRGTVEGRTADALLLSVGGVVFHVSVPASVLAAAPSDGQGIYLHTHLHLREDNVALYGFGSQQELEVFRILLGVTGVGPRLALALLSSLGVGRLAGAIAQEQPEVLSGVPGVGKRTAARLLLELKGKLAGVGDGLETPGPAGVAGQTIAALTSLGYSAPEAQDAWRTLGPDQRGDVEQALRACLGYLGSRK
ncbi:MAG: Holliday junction branch migration protein RuvA [Chloroflexi bacterium]|nr:Holliday junction branch migration protein RuvA [Chloroflexota bacterium]